MRRILSFFLSLVLIVTMFTGVNFKVSAATGFTGYTAIYTIADLNNVRNDLSGKYYLANDIVFTDADFVSGGAFYNGGAGWNPIGSNLSSAFTGIFDGNGHTISGLQCNIIATTDTHAGLFGFNKGTIQNLGMVNNQIIETTTLGSVYAGGIAGENYYGTIISCYNTGSVYASSTVFPPYSYVGGIAGYNNHGYISNCYNTGSVTTTSKSYAYAGGIAGYNDGKTISNSYNIGFVVSGDYAGGIVGTNNGSSATIINCYNVGSVSGGYAVGGILGDNYGSSATISTCYNTGDVTGNMYAGGIAGINYALIQICYNTGSLSSNFYVGGIAGENFGDYNNYYAIIKNCYNTGNMSGGFSEAGGITAYHYYGYIINCYNNASIVATSSGSSCVGGIAGYVYGSYGTIRNCYNTGYLSGPSSVGAIVGYNSLGAISNCFYLNFIATGIGGGTTTGATSLNIEQMKLQSSFVGFDFAGVWCLSSYFPYLMAIPYVEVESIAFQNQNINLGINGSYQTNVTFTPSISTFIDLQYTSLDPSIATVDQSGIIRGVSIGTTNIIAKSLTSGKTASCVVNVGKGVTGVEISKSQISLIEGYSETLTASVLPNDAANKAVTWESSATGIATVDASGKITAHTAGTATISCKSIDCSSVYATCKVEVSAKVVTSIAMNTPPTKTSYIQGQALDVTGAKITATFNDNTTQIIDITSGMVSGFNTNTVGNQTITITYQGKTDTFSITVTAKSLTSISITTKPTKLSYLEGDSFDTTGMVVTANYDNGTSDAITGYTTSGYDTTLGTKTITVTYQGKTATLEVTVYDIKLGDVTNNGVIDIYDVLLLQRYILGTETLSESLTTAADVTNDKKVDIYDILVIQRHITGVKIIK